MERRALALLIGIAGFAACVGSTGPARAADGPPTVLAQTKPAEAQNKQSGTVANPGHATSNLASHDCRNAGGEVVTVPDTRCGASGQYCKYSNGIVACIDLKD